MVSKAAYDGLFNTFFIVISLTVAPFVSSQVTSSIRAYQVWAALSFYLPFIATIILWGYAVFSNSIRCRIASWSCLIFQTARAPFVIAATIVGIPVLAQTPIGYLSPIPALLEIALSMPPVFLIMKQYCDKVASKSPRMTDYVAWAAPILLLGIYTYAISVYGSFYFVNF